MKKDESGLVPKNLDNPPRFMLLNMYQAMIFFLIFGLSIVFRMMFLGIVLGGLLAWGYGKMSSGKARGFLAHLIYWYTPPFLTKFRFIPESFRRFFKG